MWGSDCLNIHQPCLLYLLYTGQEWYHWVPISELISAPWPEKNLLNIESTCTKNLEQHAHIPFHFEYLPHQDWLVVPWQAMLLFGVYDCVLCHEWFHSHQSTCLKQQKYELACWSSLDVFDHATQNDKSTAIMKTLLPVQLHLLIRWPATWFIDTCILKFWYQEHVDFIWLKATKDIPLRFV